MVQTRSQTNGSQTEVPPSTHDKPSKLNAARIKDDHGQLGKKLDDVINKYGSKALEGLVDDNWPAGQIVLAHIINALLSSTRISHNIAGETLKCLLDEGYQDLKVLSDTSWSRRTEVLTRGGYTHYREKTADFLGDLATLIRDEYEGDAGNILPRAKKGENARRALSDRVQHINGLGPVGTEIFLGSIQQFFPNITPYLDKRSRQTAKEIGLGEDVGAMFEALGSDAETMAKLEVALTKVRLEKKQQEFKH